jgi:hypothetical protein
MMIGYLIVLALGAVLMIVIGRNILQGRRSLGWPTAPGTILYTGLETHESTDEDGDTSITYGASINYRYTVSGQDYEGARRSFSDVRTSSRRRAEQILARYPQGAAVDIYYDPGDPTSSVLEAGVGMSAYVFAALGAVMILIGLAGAAGLFG